MSADTDLVQRLTEEEFIKGDIDLFDEIVDANYVEHDAPPGIPADRERLKAMAAAVSAGFSDMQMEFDEFVDTDDGRVVENWLMTARHTGELFGMPASGGQVQVRGMELWRCDHRLYAILRSIPNKLGGVISITLAIIILLIYPYNSIQRFPSIAYYPLTQLFF